MFGSAIPKDGKGNIDVGQLGKGNSGIGGGLGRHGPKCKCRMCKQKYGRI
jgi:hypothetical protein